MARLRSRLRFECSLSIAVRGALQGEGGVLPCEEVESYVLLAFGSRSPACVRKRFEVGLRSTVVLVSSELGSPVTSPSFVSLIGIRMAVCVFFVLVQRLTVAGREVLLDLPGGFSC